MKRATLVIAVVLGTGVVLYGLALGAIELAFGSATRGGW